MIECENPQLTAPSSTYLVQGKATAPTLPGDMSVLGPRQTLDLAWLIEQLGSEELHYNVLAIAAPLGILIVVLLLCLCMCGGGGSKGKKKD
eukprot:SAG31_NODE_1789_length_7236_cov_7.210607_10_plen_91_part_00